MKLLLDHVSKKYGNKYALKDLNIEFSDGVYGILGANGAGKTTLISIITGILQQTSGQVKLDGSDIRDMGTKYLDKIGYLPQYPQFYPNFRVKEFLMYMCSIKDIPQKKAKEILPEIMVEVNLCDHMNKKIKELSGGMRQRLGIAQAILNDPQILILDEPTAGLDPKERVRFRNILSVLSKDRIVILSTHIVSDIESIANHVIMIKEKQLLKNDTVPNICKELEGKVFEKSINESEIQEFEQKRIILSMRQESEKMMVRYYSEEEDNNARPCTPNLEDVFLVTYREEK